MKNPTNTTQAQRPELPQFNPRETFKTIAGRIRLIGKRRSPTLRAIYNEAAQIIERAAKEA